MIFIANDHAGYELAEKLKKEFDSHGVLYEHVGATTYDKDDNYVLYTLKANKRVVETDGGVGIYLCGTGIGTSIAANRNKNVRAALCHNTDFARLSRLHNDANVLVLPARHMNISQAMKVVDVFLTTEFEGGRHSERVKMLEE